MRNRRWLQWVLVVVGFLLVAVTAGPFIYFNVIDDDDPPPLELSDDTTGSTASADTSETTAADEAIDGSWSVTTGSEAGYRAEEILFGQSGAAVGRTAQVSGTVEIADSTVTTTAISVDVASIASGQDLRDSQFRGRIMDVATFPTATFALTEPVELDAVPAVGEDVTVPATGDLTLRGQTRSVTVDLQAQLRADGMLEIVGSIPVVWDDYAIPEPSGGPAQVGDEGDVEFLLVLAR
jgi:polyisoprenoid-binding protein YceI